MCGIRGSHGNCLNIVGMTRIRKIFLCGNGWNK